MIEVDSVDPWSGNKIRRRRNQFVHWLLKASTSGYDERVRKLITMLLPRLVTHKVEEGRLDFIRALLCALSEPVFQRTDNAYMLIRVLTEDWDAQSVHEQNALLVQIEHNYDSFAHWMAPFVISEFMGTQLDEGRALQSISRLVRTASALSRQFLPHALEHIALRTSNSTTRAVCVSMLHNLSSDESPAVKEEAKSSLKKLRAPNKTS